MIPTLILTAILSLFSGPSPTSPGSGPTMFDTSSGVPTASVDDTSSGVPTHR
jgi:hypothetical protein